MPRLRRRLARRLASVRRVEPFVRRIVAGGLSLVAGLWLVDLVTTSDPAWLGGLGLAIVGVLALATGMWSQVDV
jgi:hypothetical protein